jgi:hypothetical protein
MKKLLFILLACFISVSMVSLGNAQDVCEGLEGSAYDLCGAYCEAQDCDSPDVIKKSCEMLKKNFAKHTGTDVMPCDIVACAPCADPDPDDPQGILGVCEQMTSYECDAIDGALNVGEYDCADVTIPGRGTPGCSQIPPQWGLIPDCQFTGPAFVCRIFIGGVIVEEGCPAPENTCLNECISDEDCFGSSEPDPQMTCVDGQCAF